MTSSYELNKIYRTNTSQPYGVLAIDKPPGFTSHDVVDAIRRRLDTRRVGHTGALDPFAEGLLIILIGKLTKLSNHFLEKDKEYIAEILFGVSTDTQDPEGRVTQVIDRKINEEDIKLAIKQFKGSYHQAVPIYSSVKIKGARLREIAHASSKIEKKLEDDKIIATFTISDKSKYSQKIRRKFQLKNNVLKLDIPSRDVGIKNIKILDIKNVKGETLSLSHKIHSDRTFTVVKIYIEVSKGTYIRQLAEDIGMRIRGIPSMLYSLKRTGIGDIKITDSVNIDSTSRKTATVKKPFGSDKCK